MARSLTGNCDDINSAVADFIADFGDAWVVTLATNWADGSTAPRMSELLSRTAELIDRERLGRRFYKYRRRRLIGAFVVENLERNAHLHGLVGWSRLAKESASSSPHRMFENHWRSLVPSGTVEVGPASNSVGWVGYMAKKHRHMSSDDILFTSDFWPA